MTGLAETGTGGDDQTEKEKTRAEERTQHDDLRCFARSDRAGDIGTGVDQQFDFSIPRKSRLIRKRENVFSRNIEFGTGVHQRQISIFVRLFQQTMIRTTDEGRRKQRSVKRLCNEGDEERTELKVISPIGLFQAWRWLCKWFRPSSVRALSMLVGPVTSRNVHRPHSPFCIEDETHRRC